MSALQKNACHKWMNMPPGSYRKLVVTVRCPEAEEATHTLETCGSCVTFIFTPQSCFARPAGSASQFCDARQLSEWRCQRWCATWTGACLGRATCSPHAAISFCAAQTLCCVAFGRGLCPLKRRNARLSM